MDAEPARNPLVLLASVFGAFVAGPFLGSAVAHWTAPGAELAQVASPLAFTGVYVGGLALWFGVGAVSLVGGALRRLVRGPRGPRPTAELVPPGYGAFLPLGLFAGGISGAVAGGVGAGPFWIACAAHLAAGAAYGAALRALARRGYLPFPEPG